MFGIDQGIKMMGQLLKGVEFEGGCLSNTTSLLAQVVEERLRMTQMGRSEDSMIGT